VLTELGTIRETIRVSIDLSGVPRRRRRPAGGQQPRRCRCQSPQSMLDAMVGRLSFGPLAFTREK
jgi:hypothetical protein